LFERRGLSTRLRISLAFASLAGVMFVVIGVLSGQQARQQVETDTGVALLQVASRMANSLDTGMYERLHEIESLAALDEMLSERISPPGWRLLTERLQNSLPQYSWIGVTDAQGRVLAATRGLLEGADVSKRPWFAEGLRGSMAGDVHKALMLERLLPPQPDGEPLRLLDFAAPLTEGSRIIGVLGAHLSIAWAEDRRRLVLSAVEPGRGIEIQIIDSSGQAVLGPRTPLLSPALRAAMPANGYQTLAWDNGVRYLTAVVRTTGHRSFKGLGWTVLVRQPEDVALAGARALERRIWAFGLFGAALFGAIGWWLAGRLTRALSAVAQRAQQLSEVAAESGQRRRRGDEVAVLDASLEKLVDQLRERERQLAGANQSLEARVAERTQALQQANADLQSFSRSVSHDLKGPIGGIAMLLKNLLANPSVQLDDSPRRMLTLVVDECQRLGVLVDELLTLAMVEQRELRAEAVDMQALAQAVAAELQGAPAAAAHAKRAEVLVGELPAVQGDPVLLRQVWHNLLGNALKFSGRAEQPRIEVRAERHSLAGATELVFSVSDNGAGFDMAQAPRLFGVFQRLHRASDFPGTGVGLSIVKRVVHRHGGRVWAQSTPGEGATFYFALPQP
jgi:signal transduction histidine kinase